MLSNFIKLPWRVPVLDRYLAVELARAGVAVTVALLLLIAGKLLMQQLGYLAEGKFSGGIVTALLFNKLSAYFVQLLPFLMLLSAVLALGRLHRDGEVAAMRACGRSELRLLVPMAMLGLPLAMVLGIMSLYVTPQLSLEAELAHHRARLEAGLDVTQPGRFMQARDGRWALYTGEASGAVAEEVFFAIYHPQARQVHVETAARASKHLDEARATYVLNFEQGRRYSGWPGSTDLRTMEFERHSLRIDAAVSEQARQRVRYMTLAQLLASDSAAANGELQWRLSLPVSLLLLLALAVPLARSSVREGKYARAVGAILIYLVYAQLQLLAVSQVRGGSWPAWAGVWWVHGLMALGIAALFWRNLQRPA